MRVIQRDQVYNKELTLLITRSLFSVLTVLVTLFYFSEGDAMSFLFGGEKVEAVLFSPLEGKITYESKPASGAVLKLWIAWKDQDGETKNFNTDENGNFSIPIQTIEYRSSPLAQISIAQIITVEYNGSEYEIWKAGKSSTNLYAELGGRPENLVCELTKEEMDTHLDNSLLETLCVWTNLDKEKD